MRSEIVRRQLRLFVGLIAYDKYANSEESCTKVLEGGRNGNVRDAWLSMEQYRSSSIPRSADTGT